MSEAAEGERKFAWAMDEYEGRKCPAATAGFTPSDGSSADGSTRPASEWDRILQNEHGFGNDDEFVEEDLAQEAWLDTIEHMESEYGTDSMEYEAAREVAEELGWLDDD